MKVYFSQIYIEQGAELFFSTAFQQYLSHEVSSLVAVSEAFAREYSEDFDIIFRISAKRMIDLVEVRGPTMFRKSRDVEYTIFLPYDVLAISEEPHRMALHYLLTSVSDILDSLQIATSSLRNAEETIISNVITTPAMYQRAELRP